MKTYKTQKEVEKDIVDCVLKINEDVTFECNIDIDASINAHNIKAHNIKAHNINASNINTSNIKANNIKAHNIKAHNINASNIKAHNINAHNINTSNIKTNNINANNINAHNINALDINAWDINAWDINAWDINAHNINALDIKYYAFCIAYETLKVKTIKGKGPNSFHKCLDNEIEYKKDTKTISIDGKNIEISNAVQKERERIWQDYKTQETMHNMMLDSLSIMSIEKFVVWRDERKAINQDHE